MSILSMSLSIPTPPQSLSSAKTLSGGATSLTLTPNFINLSLSTTRHRSSPIRMGGGPRTFPGGVSKWQWKRMQAKKSKQLLKARLARERQIYEMRKRAELKAAVSELERPWETVEKPPNLFSVGADEQLKVLADRFQKPGGLDLWSERDGPELFRFDTGLPSSRFFPKGVVHSVRPYGKIAESGNKSEELETSESDRDLEMRGKGKARGKQKRLNLDGRGSLGDLRPRNFNGMTKEGETRIKGHRIKYLSESKEMHSNDVGFHSNDERNRRGGDSAEKFIRGRGYEKGYERKSSEVFDMSLQNDGKYWFELE